MQDILDAHTPEYLSMVRALFNAYRDSLNTDLCFQQFDAELAGLPGDYAPPTGCLLVSMVDEEPAGCVALRQLDGGICEMKRLFVLPAFRGMRLGQALLDAVLKRACELGYERMRLDTLPSMQRAIEMYTRRGFVDIAPYRPNPIPGARYFELTL